MVLRQAGVLVVAGVVLGLIGAAAVEIGLSHALSGAMYGQTLEDPRLFVGVAIVVAGAALIATWLPARRATHVAPTVALRAE